MAISTIGQNGLTVPLTSNTITSASATALTLQSAGTTAVTIDTSQNVGIGTSSPNYKLNVGSTSGVTSLAGTGISLFTSGSLTSNIGGVLNFRPSLGTTASDIFNLSICAYDHSGDTNADGLSINASDGVSFCTGSNSRQERMRIDSSGNLYVGQTGTIYQNSNSLFYGATAANTGYLILNHLNGSASGNVYAGFGYNGSAIGNITQNGTTAVAYNTSSDYRLKNTIASMTGALAKVQALKPVTYKWNADNSDGEGFIAHELAEVCPHAVTGEKDAVDANGNPVYQGIDTSFLVATLTAAIQELKAINDQQAETINALTARIEALENK